jgi:hypothetical protein
MLGNWDMNVALRGLWASASYADFEKGFYGFGRKGYWEVVKLLKVGLRGVVEGFEEVGIRMMSEAYEFGGGTAKL